MFDVLLSSMMPRRSGSSRGAVSLAVHGLVIAGAVRVTAQVPAWITPPEAITAVYIPPQPAPAASATAEAGGGGVVGAPVPVLLLAPSEVPTKIPPVSLGPVLDPAQLRRAIAGGIPGLSTGPPSGNPSGFTREEVDDPARVVSQPAPRYPPLLQAAGIEGRVVLEFIIDTTGRMERGSLRVANSSNRGFEAAAVETVQNAVFEPARIRGRAVRQRAMQAMVFRLDQGAKASAPPDVSFTTNPSVSP